jgi:hypothetical protein
MTQEKTYRIEVINLSGELVYLYLASRNQFYRELLPECLSDEAYLLRILGKDECWEEKLFPSSHP